MITEREQTCIRQASDLYKKEVHKIGPDGTPGLNDIYTADEFYETVVDNIDEFRKEIMEHPFFANIKANDILDVYEQSDALFMYCFQVFINAKIHYRIASKGDITDVGEDSGTITAPKVEDNAIIAKGPEESEDKQNKKDFIKEVMTGVPRKKALKDFFDDLTSYKQFRDDFDKAMFYMDWDKIHRVMKKLKWKWIHWKDEEGDVHENTVPSIYGIKEFVIDMVKRMEDDIRVHPEQTQYICCCGGFEVEMWMCNEENDPDDYEHQIRFVIRFVVEQYDNCA
jgi:hypothetical protein